MPSCNKKNLHQQRMAGFSESFNQLFDRRRTRQSQFYFWLLREGFISFDTYFWTNPSNRSSESEELIWYFGESFCMWGFGIRLFGFQSQKIIIFIAFHFWLLRRILSDLVLNLSRWTLSDFTWFPHQKHTSIITKWMKTDKWWGEFGFTALRLLSKFVSGSSKKKKK
jgi:hypothetical protein